MGCQMTKTRRGDKGDSDENPEEEEYSEEIQEENMKILEVNSNTLNLLSLPNEVLVKIMSFLPETRDRLKLRYVSRKLRCISETPSLWRDLVWPDYNPREGTCLENVMKSCGMHIRRLSFHHLNQPSVLPASSHAALKLLEVSMMAKMLKNCNNLIHLSLPPALYSLNPTEGYTDKPLRDAIQEMRNLEMLSIHCHGDSIEPYLNLQITLKELTIHTVVNSKKAIEVFQNWMMNGFTPPNLNIIADTSSDSLTLVEFRKFLSSTWLVWNSHIPAGHIACLRLYSSHKAPLNLFQSMPMFQLQYSEAAVLPFVRWHGTSKFPTWLGFTDINCGGKVMYKAKYYQDIGTYDIVLNYEQDNYLQMDNNFTNVTELDLSSCCFIDVKQAVLACPSLQRINLSCNILLKLDDLQTIATCCCNLLGLNLKFTMRFELDIIKVWEILSSMKLIYVKLDASLFGSQIVINDIQLRKKLVSSLKLCTQMRALELDAGNNANVIHKLLSHFPLLEYCRLSCHDEQSPCVQDIITTCEKLKFFYCDSFAQLSLSSAYNNNLQQLCILSRGTDVNDNFMDTVSAHGGLIHVAFMVRSMTGKGITTLIQNSPNLLTFIGLLTFVGLHKEKGDNEKYLESLNTLLGKKFARRKLFTSGLSLIQHYENDYLNPDDWVQHTNLLSLWPSDFYDTRMFPSLYMT